MHTHPLKNGIKYNEKIYIRLSVPNAVKKIAEKLMSNLSDLKQFKKLKPRQVLDLIYKMDLFRNPELLLDVMRIFEAYIEGQLGQKNTAQTTLKALQKYLRHLNKLNLSAISQNKRGVDIKSAIYEARLELMVKLI
jgi:hypothetical protein